jgi:hypothetical protein
MGRLIYESFAGDSMLENSDPEDLPAFYQNLRRTLPDVLEALAKDLKNNDPGLSDAQLLKVSEFVMKAIEHADYFP